MATASNDEVIAMSETIGRLLYTLDRLPMVTIAVIEGAAMAGGLGVACCCDVTVGTADAKFAFSETRIGRDTDRRMIGFTDCSGRYIVPVVMCKPERKNR